MTTSITAATEEQPWQRDLDQLAELHIAYRRLGSYLDSRTRPGAVAIDNFGDGGLGTWVMKLGALIHTDMLLRTAQSATGASWSAEPCVAGDLDQPALARIVNFVLGDASAIDADRRAAELILQAAPGFARWVRDNAGFVRRAVDHMLACGIRQFLDLGAGMGGTRGNVLQLACRGDSPRVRVACVDLDPVAIASLRNAADPEEVSVHELDLFATDQVLSPDAVWQLLDPAKPVGVVLTSVLQLEPDSVRVGEALRRYHDALAEGSMLVISHLGGKHAPREEIEPLVAMHADLGFPMVTRGSSELVTLLGPWLPQLDGVVPPRLWQPEPADPQFDTAHLGNAVLAIKSVHPREERIAGR